MKHDRIVQQLDRMVKLGRVTEEEASRIRAAEGPAAIDAIVGEIQERHARARLDSAVAGNQMTQTEADGYLTRLRQGEHPKGLRSHLAKLRPKGSV